MSQGALIKDILLNGSPEEKRAVFEFDDNTIPEMIVFKFRLYARTNFPRYFRAEEADFHPKMVMKYVRSYLGLSNVIMIGFRGCAKTTMKKLFDSYVLLCDKRKNPRKYIKINTKDITNSKQIVTDIYNLIVEVREIFGDVFEQEGDIKREETMGSFTMRSGVKYRAGTIGQNQRGNLQDAYRPDWVWFEDIEDEETIRSQVQTEAIINRADTAIQGLSQDGNWVITANYISDQGSVQWFLDKKNQETLIIPIIDANGDSTWPAYFSQKKIEMIKEDAKDWAGDYLCDPTRGAERFFETMKYDDVITPIEKIGDWHIFAKYSADHRYGLGADTSDGVFRDSQAAVLFDFTLGKVAATFVSNTIPPDIFAHELKRMGLKYGECIIAPENNQKSTVIELSKIYNNIFQEVKTWSSTQAVSTNLGWNTNSKTKPDMFWAFQRDYNKGIVKITDQRILAEMKMYAKSDLATVSLGMQTRHFDLLMATMIAWQMKDHAKFSELDANENDEDLDLNNNL